MPLWIAVLLGVLILVVVLVALFPGVKLINEQLDADDKVKKAFLAARAAGPRLYYQRNQGLTALVRADDHEEVKRGYESALARGEKKPWEKILYVVRPAFVFCGDDCGRKYVRSGDEEDLRNIVAEVTLKATDLTSEDFGRAGYYFWTLNEYSLENLARIVVQKSPFLFVPFSSNEIPLESQEKLFPLLSLAEAREYLLQK